MRLKITRITKYKLSLRHYESDREFSLESISGHELNVLERVSVAPSLLVTIISIGPCDN